MAAVNYRLQSVEYVEENDSIILELSDVDEFFLGNIAELNKKMDINNVYGQGSTNIYQVGPVIDNFQRILGGANYRVTVMIYIPTEAIAINKVFLNWRLSNFRTYTSVASVTTTGGTAHSHQMADTAAWPGTYDIYLYGFNPTGNAHSYVATGGNTTLVTYGADSTHTHDVSVAIGIAESADETPTLQLDVNSTGVGAYAGNQNDIDITDYAKTGWNTVELYVSTDISKKGRIQIDGFVQCFIESK